MQLLRLSILSLLLHLSSYIFCFAYPVSLPLPLANIEKRCKSVCVARLTEFQPIESKALDLKSQESPRAGYLCDPGLYTFSIVRSLKGGASGKITLKLMQTDKYYYYNTGFPVKRGNLYLLFLNPGGKTYYPMNGRFPFAPLTEGAAKMTMDHANPLKLMEQMLIASLSDAKMFVPNLYLLRETYSPKLAEVAHNHLYDKEKRSAICSAFVLSFHQKPEAIPFILERSRRSFNDEFSSEISLALDHYKTVSAVKELNLTQIHPSPDVRTHGIMTLRPIADKSSLPYLMLAIEDIQPLVRYDAFMIFNRILTGNEPDVTTDTFHKNEEKYLNPIRLWWKDELLGSHMKGYTEWKKEHPEEAEAYEHNVKNQ